MSTNGSTGAGGSTGGGSTGAGGSTGTQSTGGGSTAVAMGWGDDWRQRIAAGSTDVSTASWNVVLRSPDMMTPFSGCNRRRWHRSPAARAYRN